MKAVYYGRIRQSQYLAFAAELQAIANAVCTEQFGGATLPHRGKGPAAPLAAVQDQGNGFWTVEANDAERAEAIEAAVVAAIDGKTVELNRRFT